MSGKQTDPFFQPFDDAKNGGGTNKISQESAKNLDEFDPFQIGASSTSPHRAESSKKIRSQVIKSGGPMASGTRSALPPRLEVKFRVHEEVSSAADLDGENEGCSTVFVEGIVFAQVTSSDALKNAPFILVASSSLGVDVKFKPNEEYAKKYSSAGQASQVNVIRVPKSSISFVDIGTYHVTETVPHMPMLLERKVTRSKTKIQVVIQVRSKLTNPDDMKSMSIALSISDKIAGDTVEINTGKGEWDRVSRTILWKIDRLPKGESFLVSARARLTEENAAVETADLAASAKIRSVLLSSRQSKPVDILRLFHHQLCRGPSR